MSDHCKSCQAPIAWALTPKGRRIPIDPEPVANGNLDVQPIPGRPTPLAVSVVPQPTVQRHVSHFATCPNSSRHRKRERKANG